MTDARTIALADLFRESWRYMVGRKREIALFSAAHILFLIAGFELIDGWHDLFFLPWGIAYYLFWCFFFRFYFNRKPYLATVKLFDTLLPSTKILALAFCVLTFLLALPLLPLFIGNGSEWAVKYAVYLQEYMEDGRTVDVLTAVVLIFAAPFIFYRPMMAWISSLLGRSGSLRTAFAKTKGNYWRMTFLLFLFEAMFGIMELAGQAVGAGSWIAIVAGSPLFIYFNVIVAKTYDYFFLEIEA